VLQKADIVFAHDGMDARSSCCGLPNLRRNRNPDHSSSDSVSRQV
jgi:hypothetical protein